MGNAMPPVRQWESGKKPKKGKAKAKPKAKGTTPASPAGKAPTESEDPIKDAAKLKIENQRIMQTGGNLVRMISHLQADPAWAYFKNQTQPLEDAMIDAENIIADSKFMQEYLTCPKPADMLKKMEAEEYRHSCLTMVRTLSPKLKNVARESSRLTAMKASRDRIE